MIARADCLEYMRTMGDATVDAVITDPPYGLEFMGKEWDGSVPGTAFWREALRVSKPGAHLLCFGGTRTFHRMACAIEDAGWEIRDCIMWVYGSGFPKSMDVSKAIDRELGAEREKVRIPAEEVRNPKSIKCGHGVEGGDRPWMVKALEVGYHEKDGDEPVTDEAKQWEGWGTCLKPAWEPIIVARKPVEGTIASNVLAYGTGALNIDACRVPIDENDDVFAKNPHTRSKGKDSGIYGKYLAAESDWSGEKGRFPANLVHDGSDEVVELFPESKSSKQEQSTITRREGSGWGMTLTGTTYEDEGSAARFFYCAKASGVDRGEGNDHPTVKPTALMEWLVRLVTAEGATVLDPFCGSGSTLVAAARLGRECIGIERDPHYHEIAVERVRRAEDEFAGTLWSLGLEGV